MQLTVRDVAKALQVNESVVYRWISEQQLPAELVNGQYYFNRAEILEWATVRKMPLSPAFFQTTNGHGPPSLELALRAGGIHYGLSGTDKETVLRAMVQFMPLPKSLDRDFLLQVLLNREALGSTGIGDGLAIPHPRYPVVLPVPHPFITLCFLAQPIAYSTTAAPPVHTLFALVCPTVRQHLGMLARLAAALRAPAFRDVIRRQSPAEDILAQARNLEEARSSPLTPEGS